jgi:hypothetical protein
MFFGVGGYGTALALKHIAGLSLLGAVGIGLLSAIIFALILSPIVVRVTGSAFAMLHLAFGQLILAHDDRHGLAGIAGVLELLADALGADVQLGADAGRVRA